MLSRLMKPASLAAAVVVPLMLTAATPVTDGLTYDFVMTSQSSRTNNKETVTMKGRGMYAGDEAKIEIMEGAAGVERYGGKGTYFIVKDAGAQMLLVNPRDKTYMQWDIANMLSGMTKAMGAVNGLVKMEMSDVKIDAHDMGSGGTMQGYPTRHYQMVQSYTMTVKVFGRGKTSRMQTATDFYFAPSLRIANPFASNSTRMMSASGDLFNNPDFRKQLMDANAKIPKTGAPLKTVSTTVSTDDKGKQDTTVSVMQMVDFKRSNIPRSEFVIPDGYTKVEMPSMGDALAGANGAANGRNPDDLKLDSASAAAGPGASDAAKAAAKEAAKEAAKKKLRGIFKH